MKIQRSAAQSQIQQQQQPFLPIDTSPEGLKLDVNGHFLSQTNLFTVHTVDDWCQD